MTKMASRFRGVSYSKGGRWRALAHSETRKYINLGGFSSEVAAAKAYDDYARSHGLGRFNFPREGEQGLLPFVKDDLVQDDLVHIPLTQCEEAVCDIVDWEVVKDHIWHLHKTHHGKE